MTTVVKSLVPDAGALLRTDPYDDTPPGSGRERPLAGRSAAVTDADADELLGHIAAADLRGRGGAGFPAAVKLRAVRDAAGPAGPAPVVVANGEEGEPGSVKDRWLMRARPDLVLDGLVHAARITRADRGYVYVSDPDAADRVRDALTRHPPPLPVGIVLTAPGYVAGEESAVVRRIEGGPALPTAKPPRPYEHGVGGAPTLVANVETLARIAAVAARPDLRGAIAGSTLLTLSGGSAPALLTEVPYGVPLRELAAAQGVPDAWGALVGGLFGGLVGRTGLDLPLEPEALSAAGTAVGCGALRFLGPDECPVALAAEAARYLAAESSRQCGVCVSGTAAIADALRGLTLGEAPADLRERLHRWSTGLHGRGACGLPSAAARLAGTVATAFPAALDTHEHGACPVCPAPAPPLAVPVPPVPVPPVPVPPFRVPALPVPVPDPAPPGPEWPPEP
ncbi:NADH-ubiquinone oxidoreductase-F iron-sulfur binding region domain-containing protein [Streptomyces sp. NRRL S-87]|uniref:NADH-ubiquinone oxidoreductase-F iron-sulfur binding region domain-containing protein n=1 Tax=Streptomyces sp. NRRL S-87 TaxID=1463920 RepID=UPI000689AB1A|nr:NADH-ubiquinone oxidoreductase-F iron-sulfur binding region domain-containing protein [Streptomyces sp. NRRL S-87]